MKKYREICHDIKDQINPSDEFMDNLKEKVKEIKVGLSALDQD